MELLAEVVRLRVSLLVDGVVVAGVLMPGNNRHRPSYQNGGLALVRPYGRVFRLGEAV